MYFTSKWATREIRGSVNYEFMERPVFAINVLHCIAPYKIIPRIIVHNPTPNTLGRKRKNIPVNYFNFLF